jgi:type IX secretion system PorP/SprF family membrane protein
MKKILIISIFFVAFFQNGNSQHLPLYSQYFFNDFAVNPAVAGSNDWYDVRSNHRYQWAGLTDSPRTFTLSINGPSKNKKMGYGGYVFTDNVGPTRRTGIQFAYAYHLKINTEIKLSFSLSAGLLQYAVDGSKITTHDPGDAVISTGYQSALVPDFKFGFYLYSKKFWVGGSIPQLLSNKLYFFDSQQFSDSKLWFHYNFNAGYTIDIGDDIDIQPSFMLKYVKHIPLQADIMTRVIYKEQVWLGGSFRTMDAISIMAGYTYKNNLSIGYAYDFTQSNLKNYSSGTHELMLGIRFVQKKNNKSGKAQIQ